MRAFARAAGLVIATALGGCAQGIGLPDMPMLGGASAATGGTLDLAAQSEMAAAGLAELPPLPERNPMKLTAASGRALAAGSQGPVAANEGKKDAGGGFSLPSLAQMNILTAGTAVVPDTVYSDSSPIAAYTRIAQEIHACWLTPGAPKLPNHGFHASVSPGDDSVAKIVLYKKGPDKRRGVMVYRITIRESGAGSAITSENRHLDAKLDAAFKADLARWAKGDNHCEG